MGSGTLISASVILAQEVCPGLLQCIGLSLVVETMSTFTVAIQSIPLSLTSNAFFMANESDCKAQVKDYNLTDKADLYELVVVRNESSNDGAVSCQVCQP